MLCAISFPREEHEENENIINIGGGKNQYAGKDYVYNMHNSLSISRIIIADYLFPSKYYSTID
jgi:hypothetical protein